MVHVDRYVNKISNVLTWKTGNKAPSVVLANYITKKVVSLSLKGSQV